MRGNAYLSVGLFTALTLAVVAAHAETPSASAEDATAEAHAAPDRSSTVEMETAIARSGYSAARLLDLGRAQLAASALGEAIASFERGLLIAPRDPALANELARARERARVGEPTSSRLEQLAALLSMREWALALLASALSFSLLLVAFGIVQKHGRSFAWGLSAPLLLGTVCLTGYRLRARDLDRAIVVTSDAAVRLSPFPAAAPVAPLREGESVTLTSDRRDGFVRVVHPDGAAGWVDADALAPLASAG